MKGSPMASPTSPVRSAVSQKTCPPPEYSSKKSSGSSQRSQKREQGLKGSLSSGMSKAFQISLKKALLAMQMASLYAIWTAYSVPLRTGLISQMRLMVSQGQRTAHAIYLILSTWKRSASELEWRLPTAGSVMRSLKILVSILLTSLLPKFFLTRVRGRTTPSSTQQTLIFQWPISTTQAELTAVPKQAITLYRWMYILEKPIREKMDRTRSLTCLRTKISGRMRMQLKEDHSFQGILMRFFSMKTRMFQRSDIRDFYSYSHETLRAP